MPKAYKHFYRDDNTNLLVLAPSFFSKVFGIVNVISHQYVIKQWARFNLKKRLVSKKYTFARIVYMNTQLSKSIPATILFPHISNSWRHRAQCHLQSLMIRIIQNQHLEIPTSLIVFSNIYSTRKDKTAEKRKDLSLPGLSINGAFHFPL